MHKGFPLLFVVGLKREFIVFIRVFRVFGVSKFTEFGAFFFSLEYLLYIW